MTAGFVTDRLNQREIYKAVFDYVQDIKAKEETDNIKIYVSGLPIAVGWIQRHAAEIVGTRSARSSWCSCCCWRTSAACTAC